MGGVRGSVLGDQPRDHARVRQTAPMTMLVMGPTIPIQNSVFASVASFSICRHAAKREQGNRSHWKAARSCYRRVGQLVEQERREEQQSRDDRRRPDHAWTPLRIDHIELADERQRHQESYDQPTVMQPYLHPEDTAELDLCFHSLKNVKQRRPAHSNDVNTL